MLHLELVRLNKVHCIRIIWYIETKSNIRQIENDFLVDFDAIQICHGIQVFIMIM